MRQLLKPLAAFSVAAALAAASARAGVVDYVANPPLRGEEHRGALLDLKTCLASNTCPEEEKKLTRRLLALIDPPPKSEDGVRKLVTSLDPIFRDALKLHPGVIVEQIQMLSGGLLLSASMDSLGLSSERSKDLRQFIIEQSRALVARFPKDARSHGMLGRAQQEGGSSELEALRTYVRCLKLDPQENLCRQWYRKLVDTITSPRCSSAQLAQGFRIASGSLERRAPSDTETTFQERKIYVSAGQSVAKADIKRLILELMSGPTVELESSGAKKLAEIAGKGQGTLAVVQSGGKIVNVLPFHGPFSGNRFQVIWPTAQSEAQARESFSRLCAQVQTASIPPELKLKL